MLVVNLLSKKFKSYVFMFNALQRLVDFDILEIIKLNQKLKKRKKLVFPQCEFTVHKGNCFSQTKQVGKLSYATTWFDNKLTNLYEYPIAVNNYTCWQTLRDYAKKKKNNTRWLWKELEIWSFSERVFEFHLQSERTLFEGNVFPGTNISDNYNYIRPCEYQTYYLYAPIFIDSFVEEHLNAFFICLTAMPLILLFLHLCISMGGFDRRTWSNLLIF